MAPMVASTLKSWRDDCAAGELDLVFPNGKGNIENHANIHHRIFVPLLTENGIVKTDGSPRFSFHALKHAAASLFIEQNWPPKKIQSLLGHSSITMTMDVYGHLFENPKGDVGLFAKLEGDLMAASWPTHLSTLSTFGPKQSLTKAFENCVRSPNTGHSLRPLDLLVAGSPDRGTKRALDFAEQA